MSSVYSKLTALQNELKVPKGNYNSFGKYYFRSQSDILETVKPLLLKHKLSLNISDEITFIEAGDDARIYVKAIVKLTDFESGENIEVSGFARESLDKKGMDDSQVTGTASSYARKYALNGLFAIDDTNDADTEEFAKQTSGATTTTKKDTATKQSTPTGGDLKATIAEINTLAKKLAKTNEKAMTDVLVNTIFTIDYTTIKDVAKAQEVLEKLKKI